MKHLKSAAVVSLLTSIASPVHSVTIDVLWTAGSAAYNANVTELAGEASTFDPNGDGALDWSLTLWDGSAVNFANYDVMVVGSTYAVNQNINGSGWFGLGVTADSVLANKDAIAAARGSRTFLSGQDADWHDLNNRRDRDDGPKGFMINAVNWAASGTGLGIVSMVDRHVGGLNPNTGWWDDPNSFLFDEIVDGSGTAVFALQNEAVNIGPGQDNFPINEGLTTAGLSNWQQSSHSCLNAVTGYTAINIAGAGSFSGCGVTIVTSGAADGGTEGGDDPDGGTPVIPLPAAGWLMIAGLGLLGGLRRRA